MEIKLRYVGVDIQQAIAEIRARERAKRAKPAAIHKRSWTTRELKTLKALVAGNVPYEDIAARFGRSIPAVQQQARMLGLGKAAPPRWTAEEVQILERMRRAGEPTSAIMRALGVRTRCAIIGKAQRIGFNSPKHDYSALDGYSKAA